MGTRFQFMYKNVFEQTRIGQLDKGSITGIGIDVGIALHAAQEFSSESG